MLICLLARKETSIFSSSRRLLLRNLALLFSSALGGWWQVECSSTFSPCPRNWSCHLLVPACSLQTCAQSKQFPLFVLLTFLGQIQLSNLNFHSPRNTYSILNVFLLNNCQFSTFIVQGILKSSWYLLQLKVFLLNNWKLAAGNALLLCTFRNSYIGWSCKPWWQTNETEIPQVLGGTLQACALQNYPPYLLSQKEQG